MKNMFLVVLAMSLVLTMPVSFAGCSNICSSSQYTCSLSTASMSKGTSGTLTASVTNQQSQSQSSITSTLRGNWFTGETTSQVIASISSGEAKSLDFTLTPNTAGSQDVCIDMGGTCTVDCTQITIESAADLNIISLSPSSTTVALSSAFSISATIQNAGTATAGDTAAVTATLSSTSGSCTISGATKTVGTIAGSTSSSQSWAITAPSSSGTCAFSLSVSGTAGGTESATTSVTIGTTTTTSSGGTAAAGSGSGSGGTLSAAAKPAGTTVSTITGTTTIKIPSVKKDLAVGVNVDKPEETNVRRVAFVPIKDILGISIEVKKLASTEQTAPQQAVFQYFEIAATNLTDNDVSTAEITFQVAKSWLSNNGFSREEVALLRYNNGWNSLPTVSSGEDATDVYYVATSPGFSIFAIGAKKAETAVTTPTTTTLPQQRPVSDDVGKQAKDLWENYGWYITLAVLALAIIFGWIYYHGHKHLKNLNYDFGAQKQYDLNIGGKSRKK